MIGTFTLADDLFLCNGFTGHDAIVDGKRMKIVGRNYSDEMIIKLDKQYPIGTKITLVGKEKEEEILLEEVSERF